MYFDTATSESALELPFYLLLGLEALGGKEIIHPFREAKLSDRGGDLKKRWFIGYYVWNVQKNALVRRQFYDINQFVTKAERYAASKIYIRNLNELLQKGYHVDTNKTKEAGTPVGMGLIKSVQMALEIKKKKIAHSSYNSYSSDVNIFIEYLEEAGYDGLYITEWSKVKCIGYLDHLLTVRGLSGSTVNGTRDCLKGLFTMLVDREIIEVNPWTEIKREKVVKTQVFTAYTKKEISSILKRLKHSDTELLLFVYIIFYTFMRPTEIRLTKVKNVLLEDRKILIDAAISKNRVRGFVDIPEQLLPIMTVLCDNKGENEYLFQSSQGGCYGKNTMNLRHHGVLEELGLSENHSIYSWKHTGVVEAYRNKIPIKSIQLQCRHHSISQTDDYLKSLGMIENTDIKFGMPDLPG